jgi:hypothetical protein
MRAWELYEQGNDDTRGTRTPVVSLRDINRLKQLRGARQAEHEQRQRLWSVMYADPNAEQHNLDQREAELDVREKELRLRELQADVEEAIAKAEVSAQQRDHLRHMAMRTVNRQKKHRTATSS